MSYENYLAGEPLIVMTALTGGVHGKEANPNLMETPVEIGRAAADAAGALIVHLHATRPNCERSIATDRFQEIDDAVGRHVDDVILQHSTGGYCHARRASI